jgi:hypothetical protein
VDVVGQALDLITRYGLGLVLTVVLALALIYIAKLYKASWEDRLKAEQDRTAYVDARRVEERTGRLDAEARLDSNVATLRDATAAFTAAQKVMENLVERVDTRPAPGRGGR